NPSDRKVVRVQIPPRAPSDLVKKIRGCGAPATNAAMMEVAVGAVVAHGGARIGVTGRLLDVAPEHAGTLPVGPAAPRGASGRAQARLGITTTAFPGQVG